MRPVILVMYVVMALWLFVVSVLRTAFSLADGVTLDALPFITGAIGLGALLLLIPAVVRAVRVRTASRAERGSTAR